MDQTVTRAAPVWEPRIRESLEQRIAAEFREMPGMSVTSAQARRLFNIPEPTCSNVLDTLAGRGVLRRCADGQYRYNLPGP